MAKKAVANNCRSGRLFAVFLVILLYFIPFYQKYISDAQEKWPNLIITDTLPAGNTVSEPPYFTEDFVNQAKPGVMCHVSSIAVVEKDKLICTWYAGSREGAPDVAIFSAFFQEGTGSWTEPRVLIDQHQSSAELRRWVRKVGNAVVMNDNRGGLWLFYASMLGGWSTTSLNYKYSRDGGRTWSPSQKLLLSPFFNLTNNVKNKGIGLTHGAFLLPVYHEFLHKFSQVMLFLPEKATPHYEIRRMTHAGEAIQPALIPQGEKNLLAFFRNATGKGESHILKAESGNVGWNWPDTTDTSLPNPDSGFDLIPLSDGSILGAINKSFQDRSNLTLVISRDEGRTWEDLHVLENTPGKEYAYPSFTRTPKYYHLTYSYERTRIKHVVFNETWLKGLRAHDN